MRVRQLREAGRGKALSQTPPVPQCHRAAVPQSLYSACAWIPLFPLRCEEQRKPDLALRPTALIDMNDSRKIWQVSPRARSFGVRSGLTINQAVGLCPGLSLFEPDPVYYDQVYSALLERLERISPVIEPSEQGRIYIGVDGLENLVGDSVAQIQMIERLLSGFRVCRSLRLGMGRGKFMSWLAAMRAKPGKPVIVSEEREDSFLAARSLASLPIHPDTHRRLVQLGLRTLGDLARLPEPAVVSQFGREGREAWGLATGRTCSPVVGMVRPDPISAQVDFPVPVAEMRLLENALGRLFDRTLADQRRRGWRVRSVLVTAALESGGSWRIVTPIRTPTASRKEIMEVVHTRITQSPPTGGINHVKVALTGFAPGTSELQLFARDESSRARAGQRKALRWAKREIRTRLKRSLLYHVVEVNPTSRIPERRYALIDYEP